jgi:hypothetical protein
MRSFRSPFDGRSFASSRAIAASAPLPHTLLSSFESIAGITSNASSLLTLHTGDRKVLGAGALRVSATGATTGGAFFAGAALTGNPHNFANYKRIAYCIDMGNRQFTETNGPISPSFRVGATTYAVFPPISAAYSLPSSPLGNYTRGKVWLSRAVEYFRVANATGTRLDSLGPVTSTFAASINAGTNVDYVVDALVAPDNSYKPNIVIGFDDLVTSQLTDAVPVLQSLGLVGTFYVPTGAMDGTKIPLMAAAKAAGFALCLNSGPNDEPATFYATPAAWIAQMQADQATMISTFGASVTQDVRHIAYSWGRNGYLPDFNVTVTCNGTTTLVLGGNRGYDVSIGQPVFGTGVPAGTTVASVVSATTITTNNAIPAGSRNLTFGGLPPSMAVTATGSDIVTLTAATTANLAVGFEVTATAPESVIGARITEIISGTQIRLDRTIPSTCVLMRFGHTDGPWWHTRVQDALIAAGFLSGRTIATSGNEGYFCGYGVDAAARMVWPGTGPAGTTVESFTARLDRDIANGVDTELYFHNIGDLPVFTACMEVVKARIDAELATNKTKPVRIAELLAIPAIAPQ